MKLNGNDLSVLKYPDPKLKEVSIDCTEEDLPLIKDSIVKMTTLMEAQKGIGLAGIQVGIAKRFCLLKDTTKVHVIINPVITAQVDEIRVQEGCLSLPSFYEFVDRFQKITMTYRDEQWIERTVELDNLEAQCIQHEIDHFNGILQLDKVSLMVRGMALKRMKKRGFL
jgi:peptide deformylase